MTVMHSKGEIPDTADAPNCRTELSLEDVKQELYNRHHPSLTFLDIEAHAKTIHKIRTLKEKHNVVMLGHNYMEPLVFGLSEREETGRFARSEHVCRKNRSPLSHL